MADDRTSEEPQTAESHPPLTRASTAFERPPGNVYLVPDDGGSPLDETTERPAIIAPVEITSTDTAE